MQILHLLRGGRGARRVVEMHTRSDHDVQVEHPECGVVVVNGNDQAVEEIACIGP